MEVPELFIAARSKRQAREWGLVLLSQGLEVAVEHRPDSGWGIAVAEADAISARAQLETYEQENRGWRWRQPIPAGGLWFHAGSIGWSLLMIFVHLADARLTPSLKMAGLLDSVKTVQGEWWRLLTATFLHGDAAHLLANSITGFILLGLAMARYGCGISLLLSLLGGAIGNLLSLFCYTGPHFGLGASGVVMACLGLIAVPWRKPGEGSGFFTPAIPVLAGGVLLFVLLGTDPSTDVVAHAGGFFGGWGLGFLGRTFKIPKQRKLTWDRAALFAWVTLSLGAWAMALR